jgi:hypothetical protein
MRLPSLPVCRAGTACQGGVIRSDDPGMGKDRVRHNAPPPAMQWGLAYSWVLALMRLLHSSGAGPRTLRCSLDVGSRPRSPAPIRSPAPRATSA